MRIGKAVSVMVWPDGDHYPDVIFKDQIDVRQGFMGDMYRRITPSSVKRLERAINNLGMVVSLDEYGNPTWTRKDGEK